MSRSRSQSPDKDKSEQKEQDVIAAAVSPEQLEEFNAAIALSMQAPSAQKEEPRDDIELSSSAAAAAASSPGYGESYSVAYHDYRREPEYHSWQTKLKEFHRIAATGTVDEFKAFAISMLSSGQDIWESNGHQQGLLHIATKNRRSDIIEAVLDLGITKEQIRAMEDHIASNDAHFSNVVSVAAINNDSQTIEALAKIGISENKLSIAAEIAAGNNHAEIIKTLREIGLPPQLICDRYVLSAAIRQKNNESVTRELLTTLNQDREFAKELLQNTHERFTPIYLAVAHGKVSIIEAAEDFGITPEEILLMRYGADDTVLHLAVTNTKEMTSKIMGMLSQIDPEIVKAILQTPNRSSITPIQLAVAHGEVSIIETAKLFGITPEEILLMRDISNQTVLHLAIDINSEAMISKILDMLSEVDPELAKEILEAPDSLNGFTPIHSATDLNQVSIIDKAIELGITPAEILLSTTLRNETPLYLAINCTRSPFFPENKDILEKLLVMLLENHDIAFDVLQTRANNFDRHSPIESVAFKLRYGKDEQHTKAEIAFPIVTILNNLPLEQKDELISNLKEEDRLVILDAMDRANAVMHELNSDFIANAWDEKWLADPISSFLGARSPSSLKEEGDKLDVAGEFWKKSFDRTAAKAPLSSSASSSSSSASSAPSYKPKADEEKFDDIVAELPPLIPEAQPETSLQPPLPTERHIRITLANDPIAAAAAPSPAPSPSPAPTNRPLSGNKKNDCCIIS